MPLDPPAFRSVNITLDNFHAFVVLFSMAVDCLMLAFSFCVGDKFSAVD